MWNPSPKGGSSVTTPLSKVLYNTPAWPEPIVMADFAIRTINTISTTIIGNPILGNFSIIFILN